MANPHIVRVPRQSDRTIVDLLLNIAKEYGVVQLGLGVGAAGSIQVPTDGEAPEALEVLLEINSSIIETASVGIPGFSISFHRGGYPSQNPPQKSAVFDDFSFNFNQQQCQLTEVQRLGIISSIAKAIGPFDPERTVSGVLTDDQQNLLAIHSSTLERLEGLNEELVRGSEEFRRNLESDFHTRSDELENDYRERLETLDVDFEKRKGSLEEQKSKLDSKLKEIDDRQNTHVRREIRKDILNEIRSRAKEFKLTEGTNKLRFPVHVVCLLLLAGLGVANAFYAKELTALVKAVESTNTALVILSIKQLLLSGAFGATAVFYIRWLNAWSSEHASAEFNLRQFQLDIERASWVVETSLEWKDSKGGAIPSELLDPISRNLFSDQVEKEKDLHPADELASALMGTAAKVRLKTGDSEVELDGKKLGKAN